MSLNVHSILPILLLCSYVYANLHDSRGFLSQFINPPYVRHRSQTTDTYSNVLTISVHDIKINIFELGVFDFELEKDPIENVTVSFVCEKRCATFPGLNFTVILGPGRKRASANFTVVRPGHDVIELRVEENSTSINVAKAFVRVRVGHSTFLTVLSSVFGWIYFFTWSASFWPQNIANYRRYSVVGLSFDYTILHFTGAVFYAIFNCGLFWFEHIQKEYETRFPRSELPVELNDVVYALHAAFTTSYTWYQCMTYPCGEQRLSLTSKVYQTVVLTVGATLGVTAMFNITQWLDFLYYFSYLKLTVTALKYLPQLYFNYVRKSTQGWSIVMVYLDVSGGAMSMLQMLTIAYNYDDWITLIGNFPKLGLAIASMFYDFLFIFQEFVLYPGTNIDRPSDWERNKLDIAVTMKSLSKSRIGESVSTTQVKSTLTTKTEKLNDDFDIEI